VFGESSENVDMETRMLLVVLLSNFEVDVLVVSHDPDVYKSFQPTKTDWLLGLSGMLEQCAEHFPMHNNVTHIYYKSAKKWSL